MKEKNKVYSIPIIKQILFLLFTISILSTALYPNGKVLAETNTSQLPVHILTTGSAADYEKAKETSFSSDGTKLVPVKISQSGNLYLKVYADRFNRLPVNFFKTKDASDVPFAMSCLCTEGTGASYEGTATRYLEKGTYYMQLPEGNFRIKAYLYTSENRTLKLDTWMCAYSDFRHYTYFTYQAKESGYLTLNEKALINTGFSAAVTLCNSKNKPIVNTMSNHSIDDKIVYALKKGTTYKIRVNAIDPNLVHFYRLKASFTKCTEKSGSKKNNAATVSFGKTANGMVLAEDSTTKADWYKITNPKTQKIKLTYSGSITSGTMQLDVYRSDGKKYASYAIISSVGESNEYFFVDKDGNYSLKKGTYYFKVTKSRKEASGVYSIKMASAK